MKVSITQASSLHSLTVWSHKELGEVSSLQPKGLELGAGTGRHMSCAELYVSTQLTSSSL